MRRFLVCISAALVLWAAAAVPALADGLLSARALGLLAQARSSAWTDGLAAELDRLAEGARAPAADVFDIVLDAVGPDALPPHPTEAAAAFLAAVRQADTARRRGIPLSLLRAQIRAAWAAAVGSGEAFALPLEHRAQQAVAGFAAGNRRAWDPQYEGRGGSDTAAPGSGPGGRWQQ